MVKIVKAQFHTAGKLYDFGAGDLDLKPGDKIIVETERGRSIATVVTPPREYEEAHVPEGLKTAIRIAEPSDLASAARNDAREQEAHAFCLRKIKERGMEMKLVKVEYLFDGSKAIFYFTADGRVDFRELVKDLAHQFHTRIEMRQIGVRDESKMIGGIGICGRELCCSSFLREFEPVSVKMAKEQNLALNPTKISGQCGRLLCCLGYEYETYCSLKKCLPKCGKVVKCGSTEGEVIKQNIIEGTVFVKTDDDRIVELKGESIKPEDISERPKSPRREGGTREREKEPQSSSDNQRREKPRDREQKPGDDGEQRRERDTKKNQDQQRGERGNRDRRGGKGRDKDKKEPK
ncbi:PSP1 domain protein [Geobacter metallireducens RCH3]|uniref:PSP1 superfamily protein n=1 Tax=Geobacter metallireducens (strain ATCC 53774 / DSM 7210 / GS-15) TaxID=269799 RepID=Q39T79_GEOMG|nr:stage 0 sporulation family protein [Geobacter metallireducens]ABB32545.1 PSP1 superfamily protein [Geobacter metallireducens GS-15]EHP86428.1 PSP1 domain protein [Geobacter metallireducens RCH3]